MTQDLYPSNDESDDYVPEIPLRDYFAGQALAGLVASRMPMLNDDEKIAADAIAGTAFVIAEAMLTESNYLQDRRNHSGFFSPDPPPPLPPPT